MVRIRVSVGIRVYPFRFTMVLVVYSKRIS